MILPSIAQHRKDYQSLDKFIPFSTLSMSEIMHLIEDYEIIFHTLDDKNIYYSRY
jgi:hypothetical protein